MIPYTHRPKTYMKGINIMGLIHIYHGNGKGKTTAAAGLSVRMAGCKKKVIFAQFLKCGNSSEAEFFKNQENIEVICSKKPHGFFITLDDNEKQEVIKECNELFDCLKKASDVELIVLDEILDAINLNILTEEDVISFLKVTCDSMEIVLTGRNPSQKLKDVADYVTNMKCEKHPYDRGFQARRGVEY